MNSNYLRGVLLVVMAALFWSSAGLMIKLAKVGPLQIVFYRSLIAGIFLWGVFEWKRRRSGKPFAYTINRATLVTAFFYTGTVSLFVTANKLTTAANAVFLQYMAPAYVILISYFFLKEKIYSNEIITVILCLAGMGLFFVEAEKSTAIIGNVIGILSGVMFALLQLSVKHHGFFSHPSSPATEEDKEIASMYQIVIGNLMTVFLISLVLLLIPQVTEATGGPPDEGVLRAFALTLTDFWVMMFLGIVQLGLGYLCFTKGVHDISSVEVSIFTLLEPISNPLWTFLGTGETPGFWALAGGLLVLVSVAVNAVVYHQQKKSNGVEE